MPLYKQTNFTWQCENGGPREDYAVGSSRVNAPVNILGATAAKRLQAVEDFIGYNVVKTTSLGGKTVRYISRSLPLSYPVPRGTATNPAKRPYLWCSGLVGGGWPGVFTYNKFTDGNDADQYQWTALFTPRLYESLEDDAVLAQVRTDMGPTSPLYDPGPPATSLPDEGDSLRRGFVNTRYISRRVEECGRLVGIQGALLTFGIAPGSRVKFPQSFAFNEVTGRLTYVWWCVPFEALPLLAISRNLGTLNGEYFDGFSPLSLRFDTWSHDVEPGPLGDLLCTVTYVFAIKEGYNKDEVKSYGHNSVYRADPTSNHLGYLPTFGPDGVTPAPYAISPTGFDALFRPDQPA